jgi:lysozyme family protein
MGYITCNYDNTVNLFDKKFEEVIANLIMNGTLNSTYGTKYGISRKSYPALNIEDLTLQEASFLYYRDLWLPQLYRYFNSIEIAEKVFALAIDTGTSNAHIILQRALRSVGYPVKEDGIIGKITLAAVNSANTKELLLALRYETDIYYSKI